MEATSDSEEEDVIVLQSDKTTTKLPSKKQPTKPKPILETPLSTVKPSNSSSNNKPKDTVMSDVLESWGAEGICLFSPVLIYNFYLLLFCSLSLFFYHVYVFNR